MKGGSSLQDIIIRDPIHNYITIERGSVIEELIKTKEFQRMRFIKQLGLSFFTYPGATHTRFDHSLGVYHLAKRMCHVFKSSMCADDQELIEVAALLHDVGHFALSHCLEKEFSNKNHEEWTRQIIESGETEINMILRERYSKNSISKIVKILTGPSLVKFHHDIISSQIDVDRFDYLIRDSYFTGNPSGCFDLERLIRVLTIVEDNIVIDFNKGRYALEHYIISRYFMYNEVYNHRVTTGIEELLKIIFRRARDTSAVDMIPEQDPIYPIVRKQELNMTDYFQIRDENIFSAIGTWCKSDDAVLSDLCKRFITRNLFKSIEIEMCNYEKNKHDIDNVLKHFEYDPNYYHIYSPESVKMAYKPYDVSKDKENIDEPILFEDGKEVSEKIQNLKTLKMKKNPTLYLPLDVRDKVKHLVEIPEVR